MTAEFEKLAPGPPRNPRLAGLAQCESTNRVATWLACPERPAALFRCALAVATATVVKFVLLMPRAEQQNGRH